MQRLRKLSYSARPTGQRVNTGDGVGYRGAKKEKPSGTITKHEIRMQTVEDGQGEKLAIFQFVDQTQFNSLYPPLTRPATTSFLFHPVRLLFLSESYSARMQNTARCNEGVTRRGWREREGERERSSRGAKRSEEKEGGVWKKSSLRAT